MTDLTKLHIVISATVDQAGVWIHPQYVRLTQAVETLTSAQQLLLDGFCRNGRIHGKAVRGGRCASCIEKKRASDRMRSAA